MHINIAAVANLNCARLMSLVPCAHLWGTCDPVRDAGYGIKLASAVAISVH
ncbi:MAG TPA: hypothetical protein PK947_05600 [Ottowia sp.]|nr:hypothetical protein [Ottowia sp.]